MNTGAHILRKILKSRKLSQQAFGDLIGVSQTAVRRYLNGERIPEPPVMRKIVKATNNTLTANDFYNIPSISKLPNSGSQPVVNT